MECEMNDVVGASGPSPHRIDIEEAINSHRNELIELKMNVIDLVCSDPSLDDIFLLRYLLSFNGNVSQSTEAVRFAVQYRKNNASWLASAREKDTTKAPEWERLQKHLSGGPHHHSGRTYTQTTVHGAPLAFVRAGLTDTNILMNEFTHEEIVRFMTYDKEVGFWKCDEISRREGKLTKIVLIMDMSNVKLLGNDQRFFAALGESSKISDQIHPQLVQRTAVIAAGDVVKWMWQIARLFLSKRTVEKFCICTGFDRSKEARNCPYASIWMNTDELPTFVGGKCQRENSCVGGVPNNFIGHKNKSN
jgi:hypothetical protein